MPSDTRYARAAPARRSPNARLYSAVPRSSQWPSTVTIQLEYFFMSAAASSSVLCPSRLKSALSSSKNTGFNGELRLRSSSDAAEILPVGTGTAGTLRGGATGSGGAGGRLGSPPPPAAVGGGGGIGRATGGVFLPQATAATTHATATAIS